MGRRSRRAASAIAVAGLLASVIAAPVSAAWSNTIVDTMFYLTRPSLVVDGDDHTGVAYTRAGDAPGIFYATNKTGDWVSGRASTGTDTFPSLAYDTSDNPYVGFSRRSGTTGVYLTQNTTGSWSTPTLVAADLNPRSTTLAVNASGKAGIAWVSNYSFAPGLYFATNASGSWVKTRILAATWAWSAALRFDASGFAHIVFTRIDDENFGSYYATNKTGSWVIQSTGGPGGDGVQFVFDPAGKVHLAYTTLEFTQIKRTYYMTNKSGSWDAAILAPNDGHTNTGPIAIARDPVGGEIHIFQSQERTETYEAPSRLVHFVTDAGVCCDISSETPEDGASPWELQREDSTPSLGFLSDGTLQLAFRRFYPSAGLRFYESGTTSTLLTGSSLVYSGASIDLGPGGVRNVAYDRMDGTGGTAYYATGSGTTWAKQAAGTGDGARFATDIATDTAGKVRIVDGRGYFSNATGSWAGETPLLAGSESEVEVDGSGHAHIVGSRSNNGSFPMDYQTNASGSWVSDPPANGGFQVDPEVTLALDAAGKPHVAWRYVYAPYDDNLLYQNRVSGTWTVEVIVDTGARWPTIAIDAAGKAHIAYVRFGTAPGVYYATNKSGTWVITRLTKSYSDGPPSIALDGTGKVYVATTRGPWAASPGIYVMTNTTGSWVVARVVATEIAGPVSLAVTSTGLARLVYDSDLAVHEYENNAATLSGTATVVDGTAFSDVLRVQAAQEALGGASLRPPASQDAKASTTVEIDRFGASAP